MAASGEVGSEGGRGELGLGFVRGVEELLFIHSAGAARCRAASEGGPGRGRACAQSARQRGVG
jgi:hypothetical protein